MSSLEAWQRLPRIARWVFAGEQAIGSLIVFSALFGGVVFYSATQDWTIYWKTYAAIVAAFALRGFIHGRISWAFTSWMLDASGLRIRRGWLWKHEVLVPRARVQHLDISRGPIERSYGLATLTVHTAGSAHSSVSLNGLTEREAAELRDALIPQREGDGDRR